MAEYQYWINMVNIICSLCVLSLAWNSAYWIKNKINKFLAFIVFMQFYAQMIWKYKKVDDVWSNQSNDEVITFIFNAINIPFVNLYFIILAYLAFLILLIRLTYTLYHRYKTHNMAK